MRAEGGGSGDVHSQGLVNISPSSVRSSAEPREKVKRHISVLISEDSYKKKKTVQWNREPQHGLGVHQLNKSAGRETKQGLHGQFWILLV